MGIIGIGNPMRQDDGIGLFLLQKIKQHPSFSSDDVCFLDGGTGGMNLLHLFHLYDMVILLDAVDFHSSPGDVRFFSVDDIKSNKVNSSVSTHYVDVLQIISFAQKIDECPDHVFVFGVQPADVSFGEGFTPLIESKKEEYVHLLLEKISQVIKQYSYNNDK